MIPLILTLALILFIVCIILSFCLQVKRSDKRALEFTNNEGTGSGTLLAEACARGLRREVIQFPPEGPGRPRNKPLMRNASVRHDLRTDPIGMLPAGISTLINANPKFLE